MKAGWIGCVFVLGALWGCNKTPVEPSRPVIGETGSETHWLESCDADAECGEDNACICGICTAPCDENSCVAVAGGGAVCVGVDEAAAEALCGALPAEANGICAWGCEDDTECFPDQVCQAGVCAPAPVEDAPRRVTQRTSAAGPLAVDLLFVVDNTGSMCQEQKALDLAFSDVVGALVGVDYRVAVTSTDMNTDERGDDGRFLARPAPPVPALNCRGANNEPVAPDTEGCTEFLAARADPALIRPEDVADSQTLKKWIQCLTNLGTTGDGFEKGIAAALRATACDGPNTERFGACCGPEGFDPQCELGPTPEFLRPDAMLAIVFVSDENDCSDGTDAPALSQFPVCRSLADGDGDGVPDGYADHCGGDVGAAACYANDCGEMAPDACAADLCAIDRRDNSNCEWDRERLLPIEQVSAAFSALKRDPSKVAVWSFVGSELRLESGQPIRFDRGAPIDMCEVPTDDVEACCPGGRCIGEIQITCESELGAAYTGYRYAELSQRSAFGCGPDEGCSVCGGTLDLAGRIELLPKMRHSGCLTARPACLIGADLRSCATAEERQDPANYAVRAVADGVVLERGVDWDLLMSDACPTGMLFRALAPEAIPAEATVQLHFTR